MGGVPTSRTQLRYHRRQAPRPQPPRSLALRLRRCTDRSAAFSRRDTQLVRRSVSRGSVAARWRKKVRAFATRHVCAHPSLGRFRSRVPLAGRGTDGSVRAVRGARGTPSAPAAPPGGGRRREIDAAGALGGSEGRGGSGRAGSGLAVAHDHTAAASAARITCRCGRPPARHSCTWQLLDGHGRRLGASAAAGRPAALGVGQQQPPRRPRARIDCALAAPLCVPLRTPLRTPQRAPHIPHLSDRLTIDARSIRRRAQPHRGASLVALTRARAQSAARRQAARPPPPAAYSCNPHLPGVPPTRRGNGYSTPRHIVRCVGASAALRDAQGRRPRLWG